MLALLFIVEAKSEAGIVITYQELGGDVIASGSGTIKLAGLAFNSNLSIPPAISPSGQYFAVGSGGSIDFYGGTNGPNSFGSGGYTVASSGSGDTLGISVGFVAVPHGYTSGSVISGTAIFSGMTFASLAVNPGTYIFTWGSGATADFLTLQVGPASIPEPSTPILFGTAAILLGYCGWRRRRLLR